jgi:hypothetical protein
MSRANVTIRFRNKTTQAYHKYSLRISNYIARLCDILRHRLDPSQVQEWIQTGQGKAKQGKAERVQTNRKRKTKTEAKKPNMTKTKKKEAQHKAGLDQTQKQDSIKTKTRARERQEMSPEEGYDQHQHSSDHQQAPPYKSLVDQSNAVPHGCIYHWKC